jgi:hypothetical protein
MSRIVISLLTVAVLGAGSVSAQGTTPPVLLLKLVKDTVRQSLHKPVYAAFSRVFYIDQRTENNGGFPVCGFVATKQTQVQHATKQSFFGLLTPAEGDKPASFASIQIGGTPKQAEDIAATCKKFGVY